MIHRLKRRKKGTEIFQLLKGVTFIFAFYLLKEWFDILGNTLIRFLPES